MKNKKDVRYLEEIQYNVLSPLRQGLDYATMDNNELKKLKKWYKKYYYEVDAISVELIQSELEYRKTL